MYSPSINLRGRTRAPEVVQLFRADVVCEHRAELKQTGFVCQRHTGASPQVQYLQVVDEAVNQGNWTTEALPLGFSRLMRRLGGANFRIRLCHQTAGVDLKHDHIVASMQQVRRHSIAWHPCPYLWVIPRPVW